MSSVTFFQRCGNGLTATRTCPGYSKRSSGNRRSSPPMGQQLRGVIFGWDNVLVAMGKLAPHGPTLEEIGKLVRFLTKHGVEIVVVTNKRYVVRDEKAGQEMPSKDYFEKAWGVKIDWHLCGQNGGAGKQSHAGFRAVLDKKGWRPNNAVFVGNSTADMQAAVNNKVLLLTARW